MQTHAGFDLESRIVLSGFQSALGGQGSLQTICSGMKCHAERVADDLKNIAVICHNRFMQDLVVKCVGAAPWLQVVPARDGSSLRYR